jgi:predicted PurR-regulated permease PerM
MMNSDQLAIRQIRAVLIATIAIAGMYFAAEFLQPVAMAVLLTFILAPLVKFLERFRIPRVLSIVLSLSLGFALIGGVSYLVGRQFLSLADHLPEYEANISAKLDKFRLDGEGTSPITKAKNVIEDVQKKIGPSSSSDDPKNDIVHVIQEQTAFERVESILRPFHNVLGFVGIILILTFFLLMQHEEIADRVVQLVGKRRVSLTTRSMAQITHRLSRYLATQAMFNICVGITIALGLWAIGLPYNILWGTLMGLLRFVPYIGPALGFSFPAMFSLAYFDGWSHPLMVFGLFLAVEGLANALEPIIYGKSTGVSPVGLLLAAMFWTWLWGPLGLLLSTPITVCLLVIGKHIPGLEFLGILLGEENEFGDNLKLYQRLLRRDYDGAITFLDGLLETKPPEYVFDDVVIPAMSRATQDREQGVLEQQDLDGILAMLRQWLDELGEEGLPVRAPEDSNGSEAARNPSLNDKTGPKTVAAHLPARKVVGVAAGGVADALVLRMINLLLEPSHGQIVIVEGENTALNISEHVAELEPDLILLSYVPPVRLTQARYLMKRLRAQLAGIPLCVGYWDAAADPAQAIEPLRKVGVYRVAMTVIAARDLILERDAEIGNNAIPAGNVKPQAPSLAATV